MHRLDASETRGAMKRLKRLKAHPYPNEIWFTDDIDTFQKKRTALTGRYPMDGDMFGCVSATDTRRAMIIGIFDSSSSTLVHECAHAAIMVFSHVGMPVNEDTTEAFAYFQESLYAQCSALLSKWSMDDSEKTQQEAI